MSKVRKVEEIPAYYKNPTDEQFFEVLRVLQQRNFTSHDLEAIPRVLTRWRDENILPFVQQGKILYMNLPEYFWACVVQDLRSLGLPLPAIKVAKDLCFVGYPLKRVFKDYRVHMTEELISQMQQQVDSYSYMFPDEAEYLKDIKALMEHAVHPMFYMIAMEVIFQNANTILMVNNQGHVTFAVERSYPDAEELDEGNLANRIAQWNYEPVICLPLRKYLYKVIQEPVLQERFKSSHALEDTELEVINAMRDRKLKELRIIFDKKSKHKDLVYTYSGSVPQEDISRVIDQFYQRKHVELRMKSSDGKTVQFEYQKRKRLKK